MKGSELLGCLSTIFLFLGLGLWFYLLYQILSAVDASPAMRTAYWVYLPVQLIGATLGSVGKRLETGVWPE